MTLAKRDAMIRLLSAESLSSVVTKVGAGGTIGMPYVVRTTDAQTAALLHLSHNKNRDNGTDAHADADADPRRLS